MPTNEKMLKFINSICENIKYKPVHKNVSEEIENHILESVEILKETGISEEQAIDKAIEQMGNPKSIGKQLNGVHNPKDKILKYISRIILLILIIFIVLTLRNMFIILSLNKKISVYENSTNYYAKTISYQGSSCYIIESYVKEDSYIAYVIHMSYGNVSKITNYSNGITSNLYFEGSGLKTVRLDTESIPSKTEIINYVSIEDNFKTLLLYSMFSTIKSEKCNGKDCYYINKGFSPNILYSYGKYGMYIDKETGLPVRIYNGTSITGDNGVPLYIGETYDCIVDYIYKFDVVTDADIQKPDINEYEIVQ